MATADRRQRIEEKLRNELSAAHVEVIDESHLHAGHAGAARTACDHQLPCELAVARANVEKKE